MRAKRIILAAALLSSLASRASHGRVVVNEILYNPPRGQDTEYIELHNTDPFPVDLSGWNFTQGTAFVFPDGAFIPANGYVVVASNMTALGEAFDLDPSILYGNLATPLANEGERITIVDAVGGLIESFVFDDDTPWDPLADGFGASLERMCATASPDDPATWKASPIDSPTPGQPNTLVVCPPPPPPETPPVVINEIHYHPFDDPGDVEPREFIEIHNFGPSAIDLSAWRILGGVTYTFPEGAVIEGGGFAVVASNRQALINLHGLNPLVVYGDYEGGLDNGGAKVLLVDRDGRAVDSVTYEDDFPWPHAPDGYGRIQGRGYSLERRCPTIAASVVANWAPSPEDGPTPAGPNAGATCDLPAIVLDIDTLPDPIAPSDLPVITVRLSKTEGVTDVALECFVDDIQVTGEPTMTGQMKDDGKDPDLIGGDGRYTARLPENPANSIVRYRILADQGSGRKVISPRPSDPFAWHAYFVTPVGITSNTRIPVYHIFITPQNWTRMDQNIANGRLTASWNARVPAVFVHDGTVYDVEVRYQGSIFNRRNGRDITSRFPCTRPTNNRVEVRSWRIQFPRYRQLGGHEVISLKKQFQQGFTGFQERVAYKMYELAGVPSPFTDFARVHINGCYYHFALELERPGEEMLQRFLGEAGDFFKSVGYIGDQGPFTWGDERIIGDGNGYTAAERYEATYDRKTRQWKRSHRDLILLIEELNRAMARGGDELRAFLEENFDVDMVLTYLATINYQVPWDDMWQNHFLYQKVSDGKWIVTPWDLDQMMGGPCCCADVSASASIYRGMDSPTVGNRNGWWSRLKDAFFRAMPEEYEQRLFELNNAVFPPHVLYPLLDEYVADAGQDATQAPYQWDRSPSLMVGIIRSFISSRYNFINRGRVVADAGEDRCIFVGQEVEFDASGSKPDPGPDVTYTWSNGMTGERPVWIFDEPGTYPITLTVTVFGLSVMDTVTIRVILPPENAFVESDGMVVFEAEDYDLNDDKSSGNRWALGDTTPGYVGDGYMEAISSRNYTAAGYSASSPELRYAIDFQNAGTYRLWLRAHAPTTASDSVHTGFDCGEGPDSSSLRLTAGDGYAWYNVSRFDGPREVTVGGPGIHHLSIWIREPGVLVDRILLTRDPALEPEGEGPPASPRVPVGQEPFVRGDANERGGVSLEDAVEIVYQVFGARPIACADASDANDSGRVTIADAIYVLSFIFRGGDAPPAPYPVAGEDPSEDQIGCGG